MRIRTPARRASFLVRSRVGGDKPVVSDKESSRRPSTIYTQACSRHQWRAFMRSSQYTRAADQPTLAGRLLALVLRRGVSVLKSRDGGKVRADWLFPVG